MGAKALSDILDTTGLFYYMTMKDFERNNRKKRKDSVARRVFPTEKTLLMMQERRKELIEEFDFSSVKQEYKSRSLHIESYEGLFHLLSQIDIGQCFSPNIPLNDYTPCRLIKGNYAWISRNEQGHYRYFSKRKDQVAISFDFLDFVEIYYGINAYEAIDKIVKLFGIHFMEEIWKRQRQQKYWSNEQFLHDSLQQFPHLSILLSDYTNVLEAMNVLGNVHIYNKEYSYKGENVFFASTSHISSFLLTSNTSKVNQLINLFTTLGFIEKVPTSDIHPVFLKESTDIADKRNLGNRINYYIIQSFNEVATVAEERAKILLENGIRYSRISKIGIEKLFGTDFANDVYPQTIQKNKKRESSKKENIEFHLEENFLKLLNEQGYLTKTMVAYLPVFDLSLEKKQSYLKKMWGFLLNKYHCDYTKPTKQMKEEHQLPTYEYIAYQKA